MDERELTSFWMGVELPRTCLSSLLRACRGKGEQTPRCRWPVPTQPTRRDFGLRFSAANSSAAGSLLFANAVTDCVEVAVSFAVSIIGSASGASDADESSVAAGPSTPAAPAAAGRPSSAKLIDT